ncbi:hypothetical protein NMY22_g2228 [Coprinellus aureogranulatus]|nr:hypothetical protein NMY22_g2228 [Coprinellus aureogranulatus]
MAPALPQPPIAGLPVEILLNILRDYVHCGNLVQGASCNQGDTLEGLLEKRSRPVLLTHICRSWRTSVISDPSLWTNIHVFSASEIYHLFFRRSSPLPVDISLNLADSRNPDMYTDWLHIIDMLEKEFSNQSDHDWVPNRIRSVRLVSVVPLHAQKIIELLEQYELPALRSFFVRPISSERLNVLYVRHRSEPFLPLLRQTLTRLELHHCCRTLTSVALRGILTSCHHLETLVLGPMRLDWDPLTEDTELKASENAPIHVPALKSLAVGSPIFVFSMGNNVECGPRCPCVLGTLVADNLEYLEVSGGLSNALRHLIPVIQRRSEQYSKQPLSVMLNPSDMIISPSYLLPAVLHRLPANIHLHMYILAIDTQDVLSIGPPWMTRTRSTTWYLDSGEYQRLRAAASLFACATNPFPSLGELRCCGVVPVLFHPKERNPFHANSDLHAMPWIWTEDSPRPYHGKRLLTQFSVWSEEGQE